MKHSIDTYECGKNSPICLTIGELYIVGKIDNIDISDISENNEIDIKLKIKDITKLINGGDIVIDYKRPSGVDLINLLKRTSDAIVEEHATNIRLIKDDEIDTPHTTIKFPLNK